MEHVNSFEFHKNNPGESVRKEQDMKNVRNFEQAIGIIILGLICGLMLGSIYLWDFVHMFTVRNAPVVTGHIVSQNRIKQFLLPRVDFAIQIDGTNTEVHAITERSLLYKNLKDVRFHYSGDPAREVFLFEYESNPIWMVLEVWVPLFIGVLLIIVGIRKAHAQKSIIHNDSSQP
jgi:hypothetical protein